MHVIQISVYLVVIAILVQFIRKRKNKRFYKLLEQFPSYPAFPLIGNTHLLAGSFDGLLGRLEKIIVPNDRLLYWLGPKPIIMLRKSEDIAIVLTQSQDRDTMDLSERWLGLGILTARYEEWRKSRKMLAPAFSSAMLSIYVQAFNKYGQDLIEKFKPVAKSGRQIDVQDWVLNANAGAVVETSMGVAAEDLGKQGEEFSHAVIISHQHAIVRMKFPALMFRHLDWLYLKISGKIKYIDHIKYFPAKILRQKLSDYNNFQHQNNETDGIDVDSSRTVLDLIVKNGTKDGFTEARMRDEVLQVVGAAIELSATCISFLMLMLAMHQDVQQKAYEEIVELTSDDEIFTMDHLVNHLVYVEQCIKETLRMFSPAVATARHTHKEIILSDKTVIPAGILVMPFYHFANYDPELYKNPEKWDPEHFSEQAINGRPKTSQLSFGYGPRGCIGAKYAMMSMKTQIAYILRNYHLSTNVTEFTKRNLKTDLSIRSKIGYPVKLTNRRDMK